MSVALRIRDGALRLQPGGLGLVADDTEAEDGRAVVDVTFDLAQDTAFATVVSVEGGATHVTLGVGAQRYRLVATIGLPQEIASGLDGTSFFPAYWQSAPEGGRFGRIYGPLLEPARPDPPEVIGAVDDLLAYVTDPGTTFTLDFGVAFSGDDRTYTFVVNGAAPPVGWSISTAGVVTGPATAVLALSTVTVTARNRGGAAILAASVEVLAEEPPDDGELRNVTLPTFALLPGEAAVVGGTARIGGGVWAGPTPNFGSWRMLRDGEVIGDGSFGSEFDLTFAAAGLHQGQTRRVFAGPPEQAVIVTATGEILVISGGVEPPPIPDYVVTNAAQLQTAMNAARGLTAPQLILINGNNLAGFTLAGYTKAGQPLTIMAANRVSLGNVNPTWRDGNQLTLHRIRNVIFDGIYWRNVVKDAQGFPAAGVQAFLADDTVDFVIRNCKIEGYHRAWTMQRSTRHIQEWNHHTGCGMDSGRHFDAHNGLRIRHCRVDFPDVDNARAQADPNRHPDATPLQLASPNQRGSNDVVIEDNHYILFNGYHQAIFVPSAFVTNADPNNAAGLNGVYAHVGLIVRRNWIVSRHVNAIVSRGARNVLIEDNVVRTQFFAQPWDTTNKGIPTIKMSGYGSGILRRNVTPRALIDATGEGVPGTLAQFTRTDNVISATAVPDALPAPPATGPYGYEA